MQRFKTEASSRVRSLLTQEELGVFSEQTGLNRNTFWQRSFRGIVIGDPDNFGTRVRYIHWNPVKAGYVEQPVDYRWSSARAWEQGRWDESAGLPIDSLLNDLD